MSADRITLSPVQQADQVRQVVGVLRRMEQRYEGGNWAAGFRFGPGGGNCLIGGIDEATEWSMPGVREEVTDRLVAHLPRAFRVVARVRPRVALAMYNDTIGGRSGALQLVRGALADLGLGRVSEPSTVPAEPAGRRSAWVA